MDGNKISLSPATLSGPFQTIGYYLELFKLHLCLYVCLSAIFGFVIKSGSFPIESFMVGGLICVLACGCAVLNNIQDKEYDRCFKRTVDRSLPAGKVPIAHAVVMAGLMIIAGLIGLWVIAGWSAFWWGVFAVVCYNGFYTPLKKRTLLAILPGAACGMLVPMIGWTAAGGPFTDPTLMAILMVFGLWQIPHFFIILLKTRDRMVHPKFAQMFPSFLKVFSDREIKLQIMIWTSLYTLAVFSFLLKGAIDSDILFKAIFLNAFISWFFIIWVILKKESPAIKAFAGINLSMLIFMGTGICDKIF